MKPEEIAWAAGFIDGEGCFSAIKGWDKTKYSKVHLKVVQVEPEALHRLVDILGGFVSGPQNPPSHRGKPYYTYTLTWNACKRAVPVLWPYLTSATRQKWTGAIDRVNQNAI
jgi:hypothetical protein